MQVLIQFENKPLLFQKPKSIISCFRSASFESCFREIESALSAGYFLAGFLSYEAGYGFEEQLNDSKLYDFPLIYFGVYDQPLPKKVEFKNRYFSERLKGLSLNISRDNYSNDIHAIRNYILLGDVYQITYCIKLRFGIDIDPFSFYHMLLHKQPVPYPAFIETDDFQTFLPVYV